MTFDVDVRGRRHRVEVVRTASGDHVSVNGRMFVGDVAGTGACRSLLMDERRTADGARCFRSYEVMVDEGSEAGNLVVGVDGTLVTIQMVQHRRSSPRRVVAEPQGTQSLRAPMPGRILRVLVAPGDAVSIRQPLVVIEAMKMENELQAAVTGTVTEVAVAPGAAVEADALLVVVTSQAGASV